MEERVDDWMIGWVEEGMSGSVRAGGGEEEGGSA